MCTCSVVVYMMELHKTIKSNWKLLLREGFHDYNIPAVVVVGRFLPVCLTQGCGNAYSLLWNLRGREEKKTNRK